VAATSVASALEAEGERSYEVKMEVRSGASEEMTRNVSG